MKRKISSVTRFLQQSFSPSKDQPEYSGPLRRQIYTHEEMVQQAQLLAERHRVRVLFDRGKDIFRRFAENQQIIEIAYFDFSAGIQREEQVNPGIEWLLDNYHIIQQNAREVKKDLPRTYYRKLPKLKRGDFRGYPRVMHLALEFLAHSDSKVDEQLLVDFLESYQTRKSLTIGELWAFPTMLRLVLIENLRRIVEKWLEQREEQLAVKSLGDRLFSSPEVTGTDLLLALGKELRERPKLTNFGYVSLIRLLRSKGSKAALAVGFLEEALRERDLVLDDVIRSENQDSASSQISMVNIFTSFRTIGSLNWKSWVERMSTVHRILKRDPAKTYAGCDFFTRDLYRHRIEVLAQGVRRSESAIAEELLRKCAEFVSNTREIDPRSHVGYYLVSDGRYEFENQIGFVPPLKIRVGRMIREQAFLFYSGAIVLISLIFIATALQALFALGGGLLAAILLVLTFSLPASELSSHIVQWIVTLFTPPSPLAKLDLSKGIPDETRTFVAVHGLFGDKEAVRRAVEGIDVRFLGNQESNIYYGLLADLYDAESETTESDEEIVSYATALVAALNKRRCAVGPDRFFLLFRDRRWNPKERKWMGWERKRGKITELNRLIRGSQDTSFRFSVGDPAVMQTFRFVITLDLDTQLPRGTAHKLIGTIAHPLNRPVVDANSRTVVRGYGIIQPRVGVSLPSSQLSPFARLFTGQSGIDPYTQCVSDVYQDLFDEGSFVGKAIFDVAAFETTLEDRVPENALLSHDLFEGNIARCGLATDVEVLDDFPSRYHVYSRRHHRWIRGDWQLLPWVFPFIKGPDGTHHRTPITNLGRWKLIDNLRRSLVPPAMFLFLVAAWTVFPGSPWSWTAAVLVLFAFPVLINFAGAVSVPAVGFSLEGFLRGLYEDVGRRIIQMAVSIAVLPHQAIVTVDAVMVTLYRLFVSRRNLLEWETAYHSEKRLGGGILSFVLEMGIAPVMAVAVWCTVYLFAPANLPIATLFCALWTVSPFLAAAVSTVRKEDHYEIPEAEREDLMKIAWDTWCYFNDLMNRENNYLIPDNIQLVPQEVVAQRTSPTNISLSMLSVVGAYDLGFITIIGVLRRLELTIDSLNKLERFNGHFLNWYATDRLAPLAPRYVSMVDSGNLIGDFIALRQALLHVPKLPLFNNLHRQHAVRLIRLLSEGGTVPSRSLAALSELSTKLENESNDGACVALIAEFFRAHAPMLEGEPFRRVREFFEEVTALATIGAVSDTRMTLDSGELRSSTPVQELLSQNQRLLEHLSRYIEEIDFRFLFNEERKLFSIGYNVDHGRLDPSFYDLLASEARLGSLVAIAKGDVDEEHWFMLGRSLTETPGGRALLSWSGTMFEYLMPVIVTKDYPTTLLSRTYQAVIAAQKSYCRKRGVPWGLSESGYSGVDFEKTYQYRAFGVPGLGLKRGLSEDLVVSPYSTFLALLVAPQDAIENIKVLTREGMRGRYGFFESVDYTAKRLGRGERSHIVQSFFAHHQGMSFLSIVNVLCANVFQSRFHADPLIRSTEILLQERFPRYSASLIPHQAEQSLISVEQQIESKRSWEVQSITTPHTDFPVSHILSNGRYTVMVDNAGSGFSAFNGSTALTRWREDEVQNEFGSYLFVRDLESNELWSTTYQPTRVEPDRYEVSFTPDKVDFLRRDNEIGLHTEVVVSPEDNVEIRRVNVTNFSARARSIELTSYGEVVLGSARGEAVHPAFSSMFIESEYLQDNDALLFSRRPRSAKDPQIYLFHLVFMPVVFEKTQYESARGAFIGRGRTVHRPVAFDAGRDLSGSHGAILDPIFSLRARIQMEPHESRMATFVTGYAGSREEALHLIERYQRNLHAVSRAFEMAWSQSSVELRVGQYRAEDAVAFQRLANALFFNIEGARASAQVIQRNRMQQSAFWRFGISGDLPIVFVRINDPEQVPLVQQVLQAHEYLRQRGIRFDVVILNEYPGGYSQDFQHDLEFTIRAGRGESFIDKPAGIFLRTTSQLSSEEANLVESVARVVLYGTRGPLLSQLPEWKILGAPERSGRPPARASATRSTPAPLLEKGEFNNQIGAFTDDGRSYSLIVGEEKLPPLPWSNVVANPHFGFVVTESGGGYTWSQNSRENRLTPWSNDPITDRSGEVVYIRDAESGEYWSATPRPAPAPTGYRVRHSFGKTRFESSQGYLEFALELSVAAQEKAKLYRLTLKNTDLEESHSFELFFYCEWVLGVLREDSYRHQVTNFDPTAQALFAVNHYNNEFAGRLAYIGSDGEIVSYTTSRAEFIGRNRDLGSPVALESSVTHRGIVPFGTKSQPKLSRKVGAGFNSCGVIQVAVKLEPGEERQISFFLGEANSIEELRETASKLRAPRASADLSEASVAAWQEVLTTIQVRTPARSFDIMMNGWLMYQTIACRIDARSGFYQSGGAIGFRDQLQDSMALLAIDPARTRAQILLHASRQFTAGDAQHWWHPPTGRGVRTTISDDYLWLPYAVAEYLSVTGDIAILEESAPFIEGPQLEAGHTDLYFVPTASTRGGSLYEHCTAALDRALVVGPNGLPLMGGGDWNDGMNEVGKEGRGESVWLGWFLYATLTRFAPIAAQRGDTERVTRYTEAAEKLKIAIEARGWDGQWYRRAYFDNGVALGTAGAPECEIDSIAQSWSVISGAGDPARAATAMENVYRKLVIPDPGIILLLTPAFDKSDPNPGYIMGYLPGIRENGAQYTHAATWVVLATAMLGRGTKAFELFQMLNPISHGDTPERIAAYQTEPYVLCGDVYSNPQHLGRGGWSWYTGSSGWLYRIGIENILGLKLHVEGLAITPCVPASWGEFGLTLKHRGVLYDIVVRNTAGVERGVRRVEVDGVTHSEKLIPYATTVDRVSIVVEMG